jgi:hypothetical protein
VAEFKYYGMRVTNQNFIHEEIKRRLNLGSKNDIKSNIYKTIFLLVVLCGCETWSLKLMEEHGLRVFESSLLRRIFGLKGNEGVGRMEKTA